MDKPVLPMIFCISGVKNSGKTTLINKLIKEFNKHQYSTAVIKHDGHDFKMDYENTDTYSFMNAGANQVAIFSEHKYAILHEKKNISIEDLINKLEPTDVIIIEGLKYSAYPKIEVIRDGITSESVCAGYNLIGIATDLKGDNTKNLSKVVVPDAIFDLENVKDIYQKIIDYFINL
jgi:molybdopterin-guanine dinucleotide biosynthesis protein MobB